MTRNTYFLICLGSGILSYFAVQAGARKVYAVEASNMAEKMRKIVDAANASGNEILGKNAFLKDKIEVVQGKTFLFNSLNVSVSY